MALRALLLRERSSSSTRVLPSISIGDGSRPTVSRRDLWAFRSVVKWGASGMLQRSSGSRLRSPLGSAGAGCDHAGAGAFLDDVIDHCCCFHLSLSRALSPLV